MNEEEEKEKKEYYKSLEDDGIEIFKRRQKINHQIDEEKQENEEK